MRFETLLLAVLINFSGAAEASQVSSDTDSQQTREAVSHDKSEESLRNAFSGLTLLESHGAIVAFDARVSKVINKKRSELDVSHPLAVKEDFEADDVLLLQTRLSETDPLTYYVLFSEGPSADPGFYFIKADAPGKIWAEVAGTALAVPGNGAVYPASRFNNTFTRRSKYSYSASGLKEVSQPYFYVGLKTHTLKPLTIYASPSETQAVAQLPKGAEIEVILTEDKVDKQRRTCFLIKTPFGLLGWAWIPEVQYSSDTVEGISYWGD